MASAPPLPTIEFYTRAGCHICDEARSTLQLVLEERATRGDPIARVRYVDVDRQTQLAADYGDWVPVLKVGDHKLTLSSTYRPISRFLDTALGRMA